MDDPGVYRDAQFLGVFLLTPALLLKATETDFSEIPSSFAISFIRKCNFNSPVKFFNLRYHILDGWSKRLLNRYKKIITNQVSDYFTATIAM